MGKPYDRPTEQVSIEEWRMFFASAVGNLRTAQARKRLVTLVPDQSVQAFENASAQVLYVEMILRDVLPIGAFFVAGPSPQIPYSQNVGIAGTGFVGGALRQILLPRERLFIRSSVAIPVLLVEVQV